MRTYYVYILTNKTKTVLYTGVTNNLELRLLQHKANALSDKSSFTGRYQCFYLLYFETFQSISAAITTEKVIKGWSRNKKIALIKTKNPTMIFLNEE